MARWGSYWLVALFLLFLGCADRMASVEGSADLSSEPDDGRPDAAAPPDAARRDAASAGGDAEPTDLGVDAVPPDAEPPPVWLPPVASDCPDGPGMAGVHMPDGRCYLIDAWFVTQGEYYLATRDHPPTSSHPHCVDHGGAGPRAWPVDGGPDGEPGGTVGCYFDHTLGEPPPVGTEGLMAWPPVEGWDWPMWCLTWCDIAAYCESQGKRLCGGASPGEGGGASPETDEWLNACTAGGTRAIPFAMQRRPPACLAEAPHSPDCEGGFEGVWFNSRDASATPAWRRDALGPRYECQATRPSFVISPEPGDPASIHMGHGIEAFAGIRCCADEPVE